MTQQDRWRLDRIQQTATRSGYITIDDGLWLISRLEDLDPQGPKPAVIEEPRDHRLLTSLNVALWGVSSHTYPPGAVDRVLAWLREHCPDTTAGDLQNADSAANSQEPRRHRRMRHNKKEN